MFRLNAVIVVGRRRSDLPVSDGAVRAVAGRLGGGEALAAGGAWPRPRQQQILVPAVRPLLPAPGHAGPPPALRVRHLRLLTLPALR